MGAARRRLSPESCHHPPVREQIGRRFAVLPLRLQAVIAGVAAMAGAAAIFFAVVFPLVHNTGPMVAQVDGSFPDRAVINQTLTLDVSVDNTGDRLINPVCVAASFDRPVEVRSVTFQGLDTVGVQNGRACGGELSTQETISVQVVVVPRAAGTVHAQLVATQRDTAIGQPLEGAISVSPG